MKYVRLIRTRYESTRIFLHKKVDKDNRIRYKGNFYPIDVSHPVENYDGNQYFYFDIDLKRQVFAGEYLDKIRIQSLIEDIKRNSFDVMWLSFMLVGLLIIGLIILSGNGYIEANP